MLVTLPIPEPETPDNTIYWPNAGVMLTNSLRRWPDIETALGVCPMLTWTAMRVNLSTFHHQKSHYPDNTIYGPNVDVMLSHPL